MADHELPPGVKKLLIDLEQRNEQLEQQNYQLTRQIGNQKAVITELEKRIARMIVAGELNSMFHVEQAH